MTSVTLPLCRPCREAELYDGAPGDFLASVVTPVTCYLHEVSTKRNLAVEDRVMYDDVKDVLVAHGDGGALPDGLAACIKNKRAANPILANGAFARSPDDAPVPRAAVGVGGRKTVPGAAVALASTSTRRTARSRAGGTRTSRSSGSSR